MNFLITLVILILILGIIVFIHELGHFLAAKKNGVYVSEFAVGMGPKIFSFRRKNDETLYSLRLLPIGGFTGLANPEFDKDLREDQYLENKSALRKFSVLIMGIVFNILLAIVLFFINGLIYGSPVTDPYVGEVLEDGPSYTAGLRENDLILSVDGKKVNSFDDVLLETRFAKAKESFVFTISRNGKEIDIKISPEYKKTEDGESIPNFGFYASAKKDDSFLGAVKYGFSATWKNSTSIFKIVGKLVTGKLGADNLSGPVGVFTVVDSVKENGLEQIIYLLAYLSINVAVINLLPVPVFDGGRILLLLIEKMIGRKLNPKVETIINSIGAILLIILMLYVTLNDIIKLF